MAVQDTPRLAEPPAAIDRLAAAVAIAGGLLSLVIALTVTASVAGRNLRDEGVPGDFEYVQMGTALAVFCFLPFCQARRGNIVVDTFSGAWPGWLRNGVDALWDLVYAGIMGLLSYTLMLGAIDQKATGSATMVMSIPIWPAILACSILCGFLSLVCIVTALRLMTARP